MKEKKAATISRNRTRKRVRIWPTVLAAHAGGTLLLSMFAFLALPHSNPWSTASGLFVLWLIVAVNAGLFCLNERLPPHPQQEEEGAE